LTNHFTGQALYAAEHPAYLEQLAKHKTIGEKKMYECLNLELAGESAEAQECWYAQVRKQKRLKKVDLPADQPDFYVVFQMSSIEYLGTRVIGLFFYY